MKFYQMNLKKKNMIWWEMEEVNKVDNKVLNKVDFIKETLINKDNHQIHIIKCMKNL